MTATPKAKQQSLFEGARLRLQDSIELSLDSLREYGRRYAHWSIAYSGGKDSSALAMFVAWAIANGHVPAPESVTVLYADTRQELPPLQASAMNLLGTLRERHGFETHVVLPAMDDRFYVYILGRGVPPPKNKFRWCTSQIKITPMQFAIEDKAVARGMGNLLSTDQNRYGRIFQGNGQKLLVLTGVRLGESAARDRKIAATCNKDSGECGTGLMHVKNASKEHRDTPGMFVPSPPTAVSDTLAPLLHWRLCHVFDWLYFEEPRHGFRESAGIADVYGDDDVRTGCIGCNLVSVDTALERLLKYHDDRWGHLRPLLELKPLFRELKQAKYRLRKSEPEMRQDGLPSENIQRLGPLTMEARAYALGVVLDIQKRVNDEANGRPGVDLINPEEQARIHELWDLNTWPNGWDGNEITGDVVLDLLFVGGMGKIITQPLLVR